MCVNKNTSTKKRNEILRVRVSSKNTYVISACANIYILICPHTYITYSRFQHHIRTLELQLFYLNKPQD